MNRLIHLFKKILSLILNYTFKKIKVDKKYHILYKIVDVCIEKNVEYYKLQYSYTKATFYITIQDIVMDVDILHGLHPIQGCFIGLEYAKVIKTIIKNPKIKERKTNKSNTYSMCRYGNYNLRNIFIYDNTLYIF